MSSQEQGQVRSLNALSRRRALLTGLGCLLPGSAMAHHAPKQTRTGKGLHILTFSGKIAETQGKVLFKPYEQLTHQTIVPHGWNGQITDLQHFTGLTHFPLAAAMMEASSLRIGCNLKLLSRHQADNSASNCGQPSAAIDYAMAWDRARFDTAPGWSDFWDVARHPGRRSLRRDPRLTLEIALLADGVPASALYHVLATPEGVDHAFLKLEQLRPYIAWWSTPEEAGHILTSGGALMGCVPTGEILGAAGPDRQRFGLLWQQRFLVQYGWGVMTAAANNPAALAFVSWLEQAVQQQAFANAWPSLPSMAELNALAPHLGHIPPAIAVDDTFWAANLGKLSERFQQWMHHT
ncbi:extracellular solute-binding protein [Acetobacter lambici]|uniref:Extracellular solute-binding protein n=1 Tax=Acetobacter lambici TaxID=1332824 RepID=A0ABT1EY05_9PROT|nr:extracellular solute-binding protein [Acetobacter lambici]MCP1241639.1 extracellular solute-binding protein [Acetobacter lambici]MCP1257641.1 extracellular solute-binding protein [Acetobacter lambici]NHO56262.1 extracellular solute-binding protein [Acetobacter lambici]